MWRTGTLSSNSQLTKYVDFKPSDTKEAKQRDPYGPKIEVDVVVFCINCMPEYAQRDIEEIRMFEYALSYYNQIYYATRQKIAARAENSISQNAVSASSGLMAPAIITNSYILPPGGNALNAQSQANLAFNPFGMNTQTSNAQIQTNLTNVSNPFLNQQSQINQTAFQTNLPLNSSIANPNLNLSSNLGNFQNSNMSNFSNINTNLMNPNQQSILGGSNLMNQSNLNQQQQLSNLSSVWTNSVPANAQNPIQPPVAISQPQAVYPSNYSAYSSYNAPPPPPPALYPPFYPPQARYRIPLDPYQFAYDGIGRDPYSYLYRDPYNEFSREGSYANKIALQRQAAQAMWYKYGIDPSIPLSETFMEGRNMRKRGDYLDRGIPDRGLIDRDFTIDYHNQNRGSSKDPVIHVVPTLAGIKGGKQQIVLDIEETPENRHYIPKIFNPNSEISFTISSKESPANKSYLANLINENVDEAIADNINNTDNVNFSPKQNQKDLPRPILNKKLATKKKSILDMDLSDYQLSPKISENISQKIENNIGSSERRRVTFQDESIKKTPNINDSQFFSPLISSKPQNISPQLQETSVVSNVLFKTDNKDDSTQTQHINDTTIQELRFPSNFELDSKLNNTLLSNEQFNDRSYISKFKWTPSWFISKFVSSFSKDPQESSSISHISNNSILSGCGVVLNREGYYTQPSIEDLDQLVKDNHCFVRGFTVGRYNVGKVMFEGTTDVYGLNLDKIVYINDHEIEVYKDEDPAVIKPPVGSGLNKPAKLTLFNVYPKDRDGKFMTTFDEDSLKDFETYLHRKSNELNAEFIEYIPQTGSFTFSVQHFTKYGLFDGESTANISEHSINQSHNLPAQNKIVKNQVEEKSNILPWSFSGKRKYKNHFRNFISRPELITNDLGAKWIAPFKLCRLNFNECADSSKFTLSNQNIEIINLEMKFDQKFVKKNIDFIEQTNVKNYLSSLMNCVSFSKSSVPFCCFKDPNTIFDIYSKNSQTNIFGMIRSFWLNDLTYTFDEEDSKPVSTKKHFLNWLRNTFENQANNECKIHIKDNDIFSAVLSLLSANLIPQAIDLLNSTDNPRLACMVSNYDSRNKPIIIEQLDRWLSTALFEQMDISYIKIILLLSGRFVIEFEDRFIHVCENFDWLRSFGLFLNFCDFKEDPFSVSFNLYSKHYKEYSSQVLPPNFRESSLNILFHILRFFSTGEIDMQKMFETDSYTTNPLDYSLSWNIYMVLKMISSLNFVNEQILSVNFAKQLENLGFWAHSIFILQFIKCERTRIKMVRDVILAHIDSLDENLSILKSLNISDDLLDECRAYYLRYEGDYSGSIDAFLSSGEFGKAFEISIKKRIPNLFLTNSFQELYSHLSEFENSYFSSNTDFQCNGKIYMDYISALTKIHEDDFPPSEICELFTKILQRIPMMNASTRVQQLSRRVIASECLKNIGKSNIKNFDISDLVNKAIIEPEILSSFIQDNLNNLI